MKILNRFLDILFIIIGLFSLFLFIFLFLHYFKLSILFFISLVFFFLYFMDKDIKEIKDKLNITENEEGS